jgi:hypothetical protein
VISPRSFLAASIALEDPEMMRARLRDLSIELTPAERRHIADTWRPKRKRKRPPLPAILRRGKSLAVAKTFAWHAYANRRPGDRREEKRAMDKTIEQHECGKRTVQRHLAAAKRFNNGEWFAFACKLARKGKRSALDRY